MTEEFALRYGESRRVALGATGFDLSYRHLSLQPAEVRPFSAQGQMWLLIAADKAVRVSSDTGTYYLPSQETREQAHEHTGQIKVANNAPAIAQVRFVVFTWQFGSQTVVPVQLPPN